MWREWGVLLSSFILVITCTGCDSDLFGKAPGQYQGTLVAHTKGHVERSIVSASVVAISNTELQLKEHVVTNNGPTGDTVLSLKSNGHRVHLTAPDWDGADVEMRQESDMCMGNDSAKFSNPGVTAMVCFNGTDLTVDLRWGPKGDSFTLSVSRTQPATSHPTPETPQSYTISQLIDRAFAKSFYSKIAFDKVVEAKLKTETAFLNLLPHLNVNTVMNVASLDIIGYAKASGELIPFVFPTKWLEAFEEKFKNEAEFDAWILSKADAASIVQSLSYAVVRNDLVVSITEKEHQSIEQVRDLVVAKETSGLIQSGSSGVIQSVLDQIDLGLSALRETLTEQKMDLSDAAGFYNPNAVMDVQFSDDSPIENIQPIDPSTLSHLPDLAVDRSYEIRQMTSFIKASHLNEVASYFQWLDPQGDAAGSIGLNLISYIPYGKAKTQELIDIRNKLTAGLMDHVSKTATQANQWIESYGLARKDLDTQTSIIERHISNLTYGNSYFSLTELKDALQGKLRAKIELLDAQFGYLISAGNLDRELLSGPYANLPMDRGQPTWMIQTNRP